MSTTLPDRPRTFPQRWKAFWFSAADPTTLGFMRVVTGLLVLYIHLVYSLDLQAFFGKYGWHTGDRIERERQEFPWQVGSLWRWKEVPASPRLPDFPHRRVAVVEFLRRATQDKPTQEQVAAFIDHM